MKAIVQGHPIYWN